MLDAVLCRRVHSYVTSDGVTCPESCLTAKPGNCPLLDLENATRFHSAYRSCKGYPYSQEMCEVCPDLEDCCIEAVK